MVPARRENTENEGERKGKKEGERGIETEESYLPSLNAVRKLGSLCFEPRIATTNENTKVKRRLTLIPLHRADFSRPISLILFI